MSGRVTVIPDRFTTVEFDVDELKAVVEQLLDALGRDEHVTLEIDETTPLGYAEVTSSDPIVLELESGALEDPKRLRQLSPSISAAVLGRLLSRIRDRRNPAFSDPVGPPPDKELTLQQSSAWDAACVGNLVRLGFRHHDDHERRRYHFRIRHGFSDVGDAAFAALWAGEATTWSEIDRLSAEAAAAGAGVTA